MTASPSTERRPYTTRMSPQTRARVDAIARRLRASKATALQLAIDELWMKTLNRNNRGKYREQDQ